MALFHIGLTVADIVRSVRFYVNVVGFAERAPVEHDSAEFGRLTGNPGARIATVMLVGHGVLLQLNQYQAGGGAAVAPHHNKAGSAHLAFFIADVAARYAELCARGDVAIGPGPVANASATLCSFYVDDPDGVPVEFVERLKHVDYAAVAPLRRTAVSPIGAEEHAHAGL